MSASRFWQITGGATLAGVGYYLYNAGGEPTVAEKKFEGKALVPLLAMPPLSNQPSSLTYPPTSRRHQAQQRSPLAPARQRHSSPKGSGSQLRPGRPEAGPGGAGGQAGHEQSRQQARSLP